MSSKRTFAGIAIGIPDYERNVVRNIFKLSFHRTRSYQLIDTISDEANTIALVDFEGRNASADWRALNGDG